MSDGQFFKRRRTLDKPKAHLSMVMITSDVHLLLTAHALTTEKEEIMGLLLGDITSNDKGQNVARIMEICILRRSDKRKDRVEISSEQLAAAAQEAEKKGQMLNQTVRVIGWYHSHPHITVHPSHVDVRTQASYQQLDKGFVGLIISCFNSKADKSENIQIIAFQSVQSPISHDSFVDQDVDILGENNSPSEHYQALERDGLDSALVPLRILNEGSKSNVLNRLVQLYQTMVEEEDQTFEAEITES
eukprot:TRINITY_DN1803_c0_g1_i2.p1 TRINITY_DN1803_c0_g1~~TRINITY_DN1803_c0_g1_i2.p1  ORF type:complete len:246 (+),score=46.26 TRINITY_DN1803_c0_g1_i2:187-924(+)